MLFLRRCGRRRDRVRAKTSRPNLSGSPGKVGAGMVAHMIQLPKTYNNKPLLFAWTYNDAKGEALGVVGRYQVEGSKKDVVPFFRRRGADWTPGIDANPRPLFGLDRLAAHDKAKAVFIVEGEPCATALQSIGLCAVTSLGGSQAAKKADWTPLNGFGAVYILPDNDEPGERWWPCLLCLTLSADR